MKRTILNCAIAALVALPTFADDKSNTTTSSSTTVVNGVDGSATVTIDVNGKKETKTFKLGDGAIQFGGSIGAAPAKTEKVTFIGVAPGPVSEELRAQLPLKAGEGIKVNHVADGSPAAKAGLQEHDILLRLDDQILVEPQQLRTLIKMKKPGDEVKVSLLRKGEQKEFKVVLAETEEQTLEPNGFGSGMLHFDGGNAKELQKRLKEFQEKMPNGGIFHRKGMVIGPDGKSHSFDGGNLEEIIEATRKQLKDSNISKEQIDSIVESLKGAVDGVTKDLKGTLDGAAKDLKELKESRKLQKDEKPGDEKAADEKK